MKKYLIELCDELDITITHSCGNNDCKEEILYVLHKHLYLFRNNTEKDLDSFLLDIEECINILK